MRGWGGKLNDPPLCYTDSISLRLEVTFNRAHRQELCQLESEAGLSRSELDGLLLQLFSMAGSMDNVFVTLFPTTVQKGKLHST